MKLIPIFLMTFVALALMDIAVAGALHLAKAQNKLQSIVQYFDYGRSVPGKLVQWQNDPDLPGNLYDIAWIADNVATSSEEFAQPQPSGRPVIRSYGMSFVDNILRQAQTLDPDLIVDRHSGPGVPPNYTYTMFVEDRANRNPGDIAVLGVLSVSLSRMASMSNQTWVFEQPAPFTYPIYKPVGPDLGLERIDPLIQTHAALSALTDQPTARAQWTRQLRENDAMWTHATYSLPWLDVSPLARLARRALANGALRDNTQAVLETYPAGDVLRRLIVSFAQIAREDGQIPVVMLIQTNKAQDPNVLDMVAATLAAHDIPYFATQEIVDPKDPTGFIGDGHYREDIDQAFAQAFLQIPLIAKALNGTAD